MRYIYSFNGRPKNNLSFERIADTDYEMTTDYGAVRVETILFHKHIKPQFRSIILCDLLLYIDVTFWYLSIDLGFFWGSWFLHRHKIPHPNQWGIMITTKKYCLFYEDFSVVGFICI